jgi:PAS domain S-box-containing protein
MRSPFHGFPWIDLKEQWLPSGRHRRVLATCAIALAVVLVFMTRAAWDGQGFIGHGAIAASAGPVAALTGRVMLGGAALALTGLSVSVLVSWASRSVRTRRIAAESRLGLAEARLASLWNDTFEGLFVVAVRPDGRFIFEGVNPVHERGTGLTSTAVAGKEPHECMPPEAAASVTERYRECVRLGHAIIYDEVLDLPGGRKHWRTSLSPVRDPGTGEIVLLVGTSRDVTEARRAQEEIERNRQLLQRVVSASPGILYVFDAQEHRNAFLGGDIDRVLGYSPEDVRAMGGEVLARLVHPDDIPHVMNHVGAMVDLEDGEVTTVEYRMKHASGHYQCLRSKETVFSRTPDGRVSRVLGVAIDISDLKAAQDQAIEVNERLQSVLTSVSDCYLTLDRTYRVTDMNEAAGQWVGIDRARMLGACLWDLCDPASGCSRIIRKGMEERHGLAGAVSSGMRPDRWIDLRVYPSAEGLSVFFSDITEHHAAQAAVDDLSRRILRLQDEERQRIAGELHDSTVQHLVAVSLNLMRLQKHLPTDEGQSLMEEIKGSVEEAVREIRIFTYLLRPPGLESGGLAASLKGFVTGFARRTELDISARIPDEADDLAFELQHTLMRVVQEALTNIYRHAGASRAIVDLRIGREAIKLRIFDDGRGLAQGVRAAAAIAQGSLLGVGVAGMRARLLRFGGSLRLLSSHRGTMVVASLPHASGRTDASGQGSATAVSGVSPSATGAAGG